MPRLVGQDHPDLARQGQLHARLVRKGLLPVALLVQERRVKLSRVDGQVRLVLVCVEIHGLGHPPRDLTLTGRGALDPEETEHGALLVVALPVRVGRDRHLPAG